MSNRAAAPTEPAPASSGPAEYAVRVNGKDYHLAFEGNTVTVDGNVYQVSIQQPDGSATAAAPAAKGGEATPINAQMPGVVLRVNVNEGDKVKKGDAVLVLEAMKMEVPVASPASGTVADIQVAKGTQVANGQQLMSVRA